MPTPKIPYSLTGKIYDQETGLVVNGVYVTVEDFTLGGSNNLTTTTNSVGEYVLELANLTDSCVDGDVLFVRAEKDGRCEEYKTTVNLSVGAENKDLYIRPGNILKTDEHCILSRIVINNTTSATKYADLYDRSHDRVIFRIDVPANDVRIVKFGGMTFAKGVRFLEQGTGGNSTNYLYFYIVGV